jgi:hypothetical protein
VRFVPSLNDTIENIVEITLHITEYVILSKSVKACSTFDEFRAEVSIVVKSGESNLR